MTNYGILSLVPTLLVLIIAIATKKVIEPLVLGAFVGFLLLDGFQVLSGVVNGIYSVFSGPTLGMIVAVTLLFGVLIALLEKSGAVLAFSRAIGSRVKSAKSSLFAAWIIGVILFIDDFLNAIVVGTTMRKITDKYKIPREMLAYIADATAAPLEVLLPFSAWAVFFMSMFTQTGLTKSLGLSEFSIYWKTVPFMFYSIASLLIVPLVILGVIPPLGAMKKAQARIAAQPIRQEEADIIQEGKARPYHFAVPILVLVTFTFTVGGDVVQGAMLALIVAFILFGAQKLLSWQELAHCVQDGIANMLPVTGIIFFSLLLVEGNVRLGTTEFIIETVAPLISRQMLPLLTFFIVCIMSFTTGSFFGTSAIVLPIIVPMALAGGSNIYLALGAVISGAVFGSHCCFFGDATVLSAVACEISPMDHSLTQLPYGLISLAVSACLYLALGFVL